MGKVLDRVVSIVLADILIFFMAMQLASVLAMGESIISHGWRPEFDWKIILWQGDTDYLKLVLFTVVLVDLYIILNPLFTAKGRAERKAKRMLSAEEKQAYSHLSSVYEAKKGLLRLSFSKNGEISNATYAKSTLLFGRLLVWYWVFYGLYLITWMICKTKSFLFQKSLGMLGSLITLPAVWNFIRAMAGMDVIAFLILSRMHIRDFCGEVFDPFKKRWNRMLDGISQNTAKKISDIHKLNVRKYYGYNPQLPYVHAGLPILTKRKKVWIDPTQSHSLIIGTTNSGKTFSIIHILICIARMCGESMVINDLKGELYKMHYRSLQEAGYDVKVLNFVSPGASDCWNPFGLVYQSYRKAQKEWEKENKDNPHYQEMKEAKIKLLRMLAQKEIMSAEDNKEAILKLYGHAGGRRAELERKLRMQAARQQRWNEEIEETVRTYRNELLYLKRPDFSDAFEYLKDIAKAIMDEPNAKDPYWSESACHLLEGAVCFLLEQEDLTEDGTLKRLSEEEINFRNIKMLVDQGLSKRNICGKSWLLLDYYLKNFRNPDDQSVIKLTDIIQAAENTRGTILSVFGNKMDLGTLNDRVAKMTSRTTFSFENIGKRKTAVFMVVHDEKETYYPLVTLFVQQMYIELIKAARSAENDVLPVPVHLIWDEFGLAPRLNNIIQILAAARSRGVKMYMVVQDLSQLDAKYGKDLAKSIKNNVMNTVFLLSGEKDSRQEISDLAGIKLAWNKESSSFEKVPVISKERLATLSKGDAVVLRQRKYPLITRYHPFDKYIFYPSVMQTKDFISKELPQLHMFYLADSYEALIRINAGMSDPYDDFEDDDFEMEELKPAIENLMDANESIDEDETDDPDDAEETAN